jgi:endonuclease/exonuclease/phosphatase family metal-dependent hydrolase
MMSPETASIRVLSWNVWGLKGDPLAVHRVLRAAEADLVCLQEAPSLPGSTRRLRTLARASGLQNVVGGRSAAGNAMLSSSRVTVHSAESMRFQPANWRIERRGAVRATVSLAGGPRFQLAGVHLGLDPAERTSHVAELLLRLSTESSSEQSNEQSTGSSNRLPTVLVGDLNEPTGGPSWQALAALVTDPAPDAPFTFSVARPRRRIDAVLTGPGMEILEYGQWQPDPRDAALSSDHLPVVTVLRPTG